MKHSTKTLLITSLILLVNSTVVSAAETTSNQVKPSGPSARIERIEPISKDRKYNPHYNPTTKLNTKPHTALQHFDRAPRTELPLAPLPSRPRLSIDIYKNVQPSNSKD